MSGPLPKVSLPDPPAPVSDALRERFIGGLRNQARQAATEEEIRRHFGRDVLTIFRQKGEQDEFVRTLAKDQRQFVGDIVGALMDGLPFRFELNAVTISNLDKMLDAAKELYADRPSDILRVIISHKLLIMAYDQWAFEYVRNVALVWIEIVAERDDLSDAELALTRRAIDFIDDRTIGVIRKARDSIQATLTKVDVVAASVGKQQASFDRWLREVSSA
ncbi:MAG: hypothetical protein GC150_15395 [Rhizobiales bacterium]|nr:hypothetical protein [Hyphomicrobiales bacterium]